MHNDVAGSFRTESSGRAEILIDGAQIDVGDVVASDGVLRWRIWYWYEVDGEREARNARTKFKQSIATLKGRPEAGTIALATTCLGDCTQAGERLQEFLRSIGGSATLQYSRAGEER